LLGNVNIFRHGIQARGQGGWGRQIGLQSLVTEKAWSVREGRPLSLLPRVQGSARGQRGGIRGDPKITLQEGRKKKKLRFVHRGERRAVPLYAHKWGEGHPGRR